MYEQNKCLSYPIIFVENERVRVSAYIVKTAQMKKNFSEN